MGYLTTLYIARTILGGPGCRLQTCSRLASEWFNSTFRASEVLQFVRFMLYATSVLSTNFKYHSMSMATSRTSQIGLLLSEARHNFECFNKSECILYRRIWIRVWIRFKVWASFAEICTSSCAAVEKSITVHIGLGLIFCFFTSPSRASPSCYSAIS